MDPLSEKDLQALRRIRRTLKVKKAQNTHSTDYPMVCFNAIPEDEGIEGKAASHGIREFLPGFSFRDLLPEDESLQNVDLQEMECFTGVFEDKLRRQRNARLLEITLLPQVLDRRDRGRQRVADMSVHGSTVERRSNKQ